MIEIGRVCVKIAGRDAGLKCVIVDTLGKQFVLIDGETRRRKCNMFHLEPLSQMLKISKGASHADVAKAFKELGITLEVKKQKARTGKPAKVASPKPAAKPAEKPGVKLGPKSLLRNDRINRQLHFFKSPSDLLNFLRVELSRLSVLEFLCK